MKSFIGACDTCMDFFPMDVIYRACPVCGDELKDVIE